MKMKIRRIDEEAMIPNYAHADDSGMDLYSVEEKTIDPGETVLIKTGIQIELPNGTEAQIRPRSGLALKYSVTVLNTPGTIDEGYRGEIGVILINHGKERFTVKKNMRVAQLVVSPIIRVDTVEVDILSTTHRRDNGFGSTGI